MRTLGRIFAFAGLVGVATALFIVLVGLFTAPAIGAFARLIEVAL